MPLIMHLIMPFVGMLAKNSKIYYSICFLSFALLSSYIFYKKYKVEQKWTLKNISRFIILFGHFIFIYLVALFVWFFLTSTVTNLTDNSVLKWALLFILFCLYCVASTLASINKGLIYYIPLLLISFILIMFAFATKGIPNVMSSFKVGNYNTSFSIEKKHVVALDKEFAFEPIKGTEIMFIKDVWVLSNSRSKLIISPSDKSNIRVSINSQNIINEWYPETVNTKDKKPVQIADKS
jgi:hypothetical protein